MQIVDMGGDPGHIGREVGKWDSKEEAVFEEPIQDFSDCVDVVDATEETGESHSCVLLVSPFS